MTLSLRNGMRGVLLLKRCVQRLQHVTKRGLNESGFPDNSPDFDDWIEDMGRDLERALSEIQEPVSRSASKLLEFRLKHQSDELFH